MGPGGAVRRAAMTYWSRQTGSRGTDMLSLYVIHYPCNWQRGAQKNDTFLFYYGFSTYTSWTLEEEWYQGKVINLLACSYWWCVRVRSESARGKKPRKTQFLEPVDQGVGRSCQVQLHCGSQENRVIPLCCWDEAPQVRFWTALDTDVDVSAEMVYLYRLQLRGFLLEGKI